MVMINEFVTMLITSTLFKVCLWLGIFNELGASRFAEHSIFGQSAFFRPHLGYFQGNLKTTITKKIFSTEPFLN